MIRLPLRTDATPWYEFETDLAGKTYLLEFRWNAREGAWFFSMKALDGDPIFTGQRIVVGYELLHRFWPHPKAPRGYLFALDALTGSQVDPGLGELGTRVQMYFDTEDA